jgi:hypothetical protein
MFGRPSCGGRRVSNFAFNGLVVKVLSPLFDVNYTKDSLFFYTYSTTVYLLCIILLAKIEVFRSGFSLVLGEFSGGFWCSKFGKCLWFLAVVTAILLGVKLRKICKNLPATLVQFRRCSSCSLDQI